MAEELDAVDSSERNKKAKKKGNSKIQMKNDISFRPEKNENGTWV